MSKYILIILVIILNLVACNNEVVEVVDPPEIIELDTTSYHKMKLSTDTNGVPFLIKYKEEMVDENYGDVLIEVLDTKCKRVWSLKWRDLYLTGKYLSSKPMIYETYLIMNVQGVISIHDLLTGTFLWELQTSNENTNFYVHEQILYVLYHEDNFITGVQLSDGKKIFEVLEEDRFEGVNRLKVDGKNVLAFKEEQAGKENHLKTHVFALDGTYEGKHFKRIEIEKIKNVKWDEIEASSSFDQAINIIDFQRKSVWSEDVKGYGEKEWIEMKKAMPTVVHNLVIYNGDHSNEKNFIENSKIKYASITVGEGRSFKYIFEEFVYNEPVIIEFIQPVTADYLILTIEEVEPGTMYKNTSITEIYTQ